jgi:SAM-dependent methyltransferase
LYRDKDYDGEARYVDSLVRRFAPDARTMLELGCGTGRYSSAFARLGYRVHGVDLSGEMLAEASRAANENVKFSAGDARTVRLGERFDAVTALFHVMSYQTSNDDAIGMLRTMKEHLAPGGLAVFDFWYGPAVLTQRPEVRFKEVWDEDIKVSRVAVPEMDYARNTVAVNYTAFVRDRNTGNVSELRETHDMRYFFDAELDLMCDIAGMAVVRTEAWMGGAHGLDSWGVVKALRRA